MPDTKCPIGINHEVEWPTYIHHRNEHGEGDCMVVIPHHIIETAWTALNEFMGSVEPGTKISKDIFAALDEAYSNLDAYKHYEYEDHTYRVVGDAMAAFRGADKADKPIR